MPATTAATVTRPIAARPTNAALREKQEPQHRDRADAHHQERQTHRPAPRRVDVMGPARVVRRPYASTRGKWRAGRDDFRLKPAIGRFAHGKPMWAAQRCLTISRDSCARATRRGKIAAIMPMRGDKRMATPAKIAAITGAGERHRQGLGALPAGGRLDRTCSRDDAQAHARGNLATARQRAAAAYLLAVPTDVSDAASIASVVRCGEKRLTAGSTRCSTVPGSAPAAFRSKI